MLLSNTRENAYMLTVHCIVVSLFFDLIAVANNAALLCLSAETKQKAVMKLVLAVVAKSRFDCSADLFTPHTRRLKSCIRF